MTFQILPLALPIVVVLLPSPWRAVPGFIAVLFGAGDGMADVPRIFSIVASAASVKRRDPYSVSAFSPATPSSHTVLARIVEKGGAF